jgi:hypothetical protein
VPTELNHAILTKNVFPVFASSLEGQHHYLNNDAMSIGTAELHRLVLAVFVFRVRGGALATLNATSTRHAWEDHASLCSPLTLLAVAIGVMWIHNALFMKHAPTIIVFGAKLDNV